MGKRQASRRWLTGIALKRRGLVMIATGVLIVTACAGVDSGGSAGSMIAPRRNPVTTHEGLTTTLAGHPSVADGIENPMPLGGAMLVGGWNVVVVGRTESSMSDKSVLVAVRIRATYGGSPERGSFFRDVSFGATGAGGSQYGLERDCADGIESESGVIAREVVEGNLCFVADGEIDDLILVVDARGAPRPHRVFLATE